MLPIERFSFWCTIIISTARSNPRVLKAGAALSADLMLQLIADNSLLCSLMDWQPRFDGLEDIISHALAWERQLGSKV